MKLRADQSRLPIGLLVAGLVVAGLTLSGCTPADTTDAEGTSTISCGPDATTPAAQDPDVIAETPAAKRPSTLTIGALLGAPGADPQLSAAQNAGVELAVSEINSSVSGVLGGNVSLDTADPAAPAATSAATFLTDGVTAIVGPPLDPSGDSSVIDQITATGTVLVSPSDTGTAADRLGLTRSDYYFRAIPSHAIEGAALADRVHSDGHSKVAILSIDTAYGREMETNIAREAVKKGVKIVATATFQPGSKNFSSAIASITSAKPSAIVIVSDARSSGVIPAVTEAKTVDEGAVYLVGDGVLDYSSSLPEGSLNCSVGVRAGMTATDDLTSRLRGADPQLSSFGFAAEAYDATALIALAAIEAGGTSGAQIRDALRTVSEGGAACTGFAECADLLAAGEDIDYEGQSGPVDFDAKGDESEGPVGIYEYGKANTPAAVGSGYGKLALPAN